MSASETIAKAIEKLEETRAAATGGEWYADSHVGGDGSVVMGDGLRQAHLPGRMEDHRGNAELIVTLYRTIDAQLAILRHAADQIGAWSEEDARFGWPREIALATAILGGDL